jgi:hypothetical protein
VGNPVSQDSCTTTIVFEPSVAVGVGAFDARALENGVELTWSIAADEAISGFEIYKKTGLEGTQELVNSASLIPATERTYFDRDIEAGRVYQYTLLVIAGDGSELQSRTITISKKVATLELFQNYPNPFNPTTTISFGLPQDVYVDLAVYTSQGKLVKRLVDDVMSSGVKEVLWDGTSENGSRVGSGVYFYRIKAGKIVETRKMILLK